MMDTDPGGILPLLQTFASAMCLKIEHGSLKNEAICIGIVDYA